MNINDIKARYSKIERLKNLLCTENFLPLDHAALDSLDKPFNVGKRISVEGQNISINKRPYYALEIKKITINTEGSLAVYDRYGKKLCGCFALNLSTKNIELFCLWARKNNIPAEIVSGRAEWAFQLLFAIVVFAAVMILKFLRAMS